MLLDLVDDPLPHRLAHLIEEDGRQLVYIDVAATEGPDDELLLVAGAADRHWLWRSSVGRPRYLFLYGRGLDGLLAEDLADAVRKGGALGRDRAAMRKRLLIREGLRRGEEAVDGEEVVYVERVQPGVSVAEGKAGDEVVLCGRRGIGDVI